MGASRFGHLSLAGVLALVGTLPVPSPDGDGRARNARTAAVEVVTVDRAASAAAPAVRSGFLPPQIVESRVIGTSVEGRPIVAERMGAPGGTVVMLVGVIHGDEVKGSEITRLLRTMPTPVGIDLWLIDTMNPDGVANGTRTNANDVDLNRNFSVGWSYIAKSPSHRQYSGEQPADQPETQALEAFVRDIRPAVGIFYHQDADTISINGARKEIPTSYGGLVGLVPVPGGVPCSQRCTGTAGTFVNTAVPGSTTFLVELPGSAQVNDGMIRRHAVAVLLVSQL